MFLMFSLRRPDVLPVGDLGVQKGLLRWALAAHGSLPASKVKGKANTEFTKKYATKKDVVVDTVDEAGNGEIDTLIKRPSTPVPGEQQKLPPTPLTPTTTAPAAAILHTPGISRAPPTPATPAETLEVPARELPPPTPEVLIEAPLHDPSWDEHRSAPLGEGLSVEIMRARLSGKKAK